MDYISVEEFKKQPEKAQKVLLDWWKKNAEGSDLIGYIGSVPSYKKLSPWIAKNVALDCLPIGEETLPLFTEGQLRKFIEDKTYTKVQIYYDGDYGYTVDIGYKDSFKEEHWGTYEKLGHDLLQAYWQVACKIAEE